MSALASTQWLVTKNKTNSYSYTWHIKNFSWTECSFIGLQSSKISNIFFMRNENLVNIKCWLELTREVDDSGQLLPWLRLTLTTVTLHGSGKVLDHMLTTDHRHTCVAWISARQRKCMSKLLRCPYKDQFVFTCPEFVLFDDLLNKDKQLVCNGKLTIECQLHTVTNEARRVDSWLFHPVKSVVNVNAKRTLLNDIKHMLDTAQASDITLVANDGKEFPAHAFILSSRSSVFAAMFEHNMRERLERRVAIEDMTSPAVAGLLEFMYTDRVSDITTLAPELLSAANKYHIPRLKTLCEKEMVADLNVDNAAEYFFLADLYKADQLRTEAKRFAVTHYEVKKTEGWKKVERSKPHLTDEVTNEIVQLIYQLTST